MLNQIQDTILKKSSRTIPKIYNYFLYLGFLGLCSAVAVLVLDWTIYPQYITTILADAEPHVSGNIHFILRQLHSMDGINFLLIGLGFFAVLGRNNVKERYIFLLLFLLSSVGTLTIFNVMPGGYLIFDDNTYWVLTGHFTVVLTSIILSYTLYNSWRNKDNHKLVSSISIMLVLVQFIPFVLYFIGGSLRLRYDDILGEIVGTLSGALTIIGSYQVVAILGFLTYGLLFKRELGKVKEQSEDTAREEEDLNDVPDDTITVNNEPLVEQKTYRSFMYIGFIGLLATIIIYVFELMIYPEYIYATFTEGFIPALRYNVQLNFMHSMDVFFRLCIGLGFFGLLAKYGKSSGYIFPILLLQPQYILQMPLFDLLVAITQFEEALILELSAFILTVGEGVVLGVLLFISLRSVSNKWKIGLASFTFVVSHVSLDVWSFATRHLAPVYDFTNPDFTQWTVEGSFGNTMFIVIPRVLGAIVCAIIFAALLAYEIRTDVHPSGELQQEKEMIDDTVMEKVISR
ncbi:MAG: hypothetical protein E4H14_09975 [Candidatus Thorarchaeota archaeon]|nr:MAG: hypothetical protein E4H14_09975 [Candidatus Thorarchaeota archaeon]